MDRRAHPRRGARARALGVGALTCLVGSCVGGTALAQEAPGQPGPAPQATASATASPSAAADPAPTASPAPTAQPTTAPGPSASAEPTAPTDAPSATAMGQPTPAPTSSASPVLSAPSATPAPNASPTSSPAPSRSPSASPTPSAQPTPTREPTREPTQEPTRAPAPQPSATGGSGGAGGAPSPGGSDGGSAASDVAPGGQEAVVPYAPGSRDAGARAEGGSSARPQARGRADAHGGFSPLREQGREPTLAGVSGWVSYYLDRDDGSARSDRTSGGAPVDSNDNAGVQAVRGESGDASLTTEAGAGAPDLSALRGPVPIIVFSALALGGIVLVIHRSSRTLGGPGRTGRR